MSKEEAVDEARFAIKLLKGYELDLPLVFDPETIRNDVARTDDISGEQFTKNAIAFLEEIKKEGYAPAIYSNLVWQDYYFDLSKLKDYEIWYADYSKLPQTPYDFTYWQFSERDSFSSLYIKCKSYGMNLTFLYFSMSSGTFVQSE